MLKKIGLVVLATCLSCYISAKNISGYVFEKSNARNVVLPGVNVFYSGTGIGTVTNEDGFFDLEAVAGRTHISFSFVGFKTDSIEVKAGREYKIVLKKDLELKEFVVYRKRSTTSIERLNPIHTERIDGAELHKAACCNLSESFETNPSVDVSFSDAVTGAKQIKLLGLAGKYSQLQTENYPALKGLASNYALTWVPGPWMESIQVSKGTSSVLTGYESITGQINVEFKKPDSEELAHFNLFSTIDGSMDFNANYSYEFNDTLSTALFVHGNNFQNKIDVNDDGFLSAPLIRRGQVFNRWRFSPNHHFMSQAGIQILSEERIGGQKDFEPGKSKTASDPYGIQLINNHAEAFFKGGYTFENDRTSIAFISSYMIHDMENNYGLNTHKADERMGYASFVLTQPLDFWSKHMLNFGTGIYYDNIEESFKGNDYQKKESVPAVYSEYSFKPSDHFTLLAGMRADFHNLNGTFFTPRLHMRYEPVHEVAFRISAGKGYRTSNVLSDFSYAMASSRAFNLSQLEHSYYFEDAWNYGLSITQDYHIANRPLKITLEANRTDFVDQLVADFESSATEVLFYGLEGESFANNFQAEIKYELFPRFDLLVAYRYNDVKQTIGGELKQMPLTSRYKGLITANYATNLKKWMFDYTVQFNGGGRIPVTPGATGGNDVGDTFSPYTVMNFQVTKYFKHWNLYLGSENLTNFTMDTPVISADNPTGAYFDATKTWGPVMGRRVYAGIRITIDK